MKRVMVVGGPCSGKSTFARQLGALTGLPVRHIDLVHWKPGWTERPMAEKLPIMAQWEAGEAWIIEGGLSATNANRMARADTIIWLDIALGVRLWRVLRRRWQFREGVRPDLPANCPERLNWAFFHYIITSNRSVQARNARMRHEAPHAAFHHLTSAGAAERWLAAQPHLSCP